VAARSATTSPGTCSTAGYEVTLLEKEKLRAQWLSHQLGSCSIMGRHGDEMAFLATTGNRARRCRGRRHR